MSGGEASARASPPQIPTQKGAAHAAPAERGVGDDSSVGEAVPASPGTDPQVANSSGAQPSGLSHVGGASSATRADGDGSAGAGAGATAMPSLGVSAAQREMRKEIEALYAANNPEKLPQVDALLAKYGDRKLLAMVRKKYAVTPPRKEIEALYAANNPEKLAEVDGLIAKYGDRRLLAMVRKKYGVASPRAATAGSRGIDKSPPQSPRAPGVVAVTFTQPGPLGLKFAPNRQRQAIELLGVNPGTQAEQHRQLVAGLVLEAVSGVAVAGKSYQEVLGMIKAGGRPLPMTFAAAVTAGSTPFVEATDTTDDSE